MRSANSHPSKGAPRQRNRRGFTLILAALMMTILIGAAAFAVDFGRMYLYRNQLHAATDAAALAAAFRVMQLQPPAVRGTDPSDSAVSYAGRHTAGNAA